MGEKIRLWVNKVGPYNNPQETYNYYYLPFCAPQTDKKPAHKWGGLGEVLGGNELIDSQLDIKFRSTYIQNKPKKGDRQLHVYFTFSTLIAQAYKTCNAGGN